MELQLLGMAAASARLGIHTCTLRNWCTAGKLKPLRDSAGRRLFAAKDIDKLAAERAGKAEVRK